MAHSCLRMFETTPNSLEYLVLLWSSDPDAPSMGKCDCNTAPLPGLQSIDTLLTDDHHYEYVVIA
jgi:hypothetical protein